MRRIKAAAPTGYEDSPSTRPLMLGAEFPFADSACPAMGVRVIVGVALDQAPFFLESSFCGVKPGPHRKAVAMQPLTFGPNALWTARTLNLRRKCRGKSRWSPWNAP